MKNMTMFDKVKWKNCECFIFGRRSTGRMDLRLLDGTKLNTSVSYKALILLESRKGYLTERRKAVPPTGKGKRLRYLLWVSLPKQIMTDYIEKMRTVPYITPQNTAYFEKLRNALGFLCEEDEMSRITGLWYVDEPTCDSGMQIIVRSELPAKTIERLKLDALIYDFLQHEIAYDYYRDFVDANGMIITDVDDIENWLDEGKVLCVYDKERSVYNASIGC